MPEPGSRRGRSPAKSLERRVMQALRTLDDPVVACNLVDLGCLYDLAVTGDGQVQIRFTLTERGQADALLMPERIRRLLEEIDGVRAVQARLVWEPAWSTERMSDHARQLLQLELPGLANGQYPQDDARLIPQHLPGDNVGVVLHGGEHDLIA